MERRDWLYVIEKNTKSNLRIRMENTVGMNEHKERMERSEW